MYCVDPTKTRKMTNIKCLILLQTVVQLCDSKDHINCGY